MHIDPEPCIQQLLLSHSKRKQTIKWFSPLEFMILAYPNKNWKPQLITNPMISIPFIIDHPNIFKDLTNIIYNPNYPIIPSSYDLKQLLSNNTIIDPLTITTDPNMLSEHYNFAFQIPQNLITSKVYQNKHINHILDLYPNLYNPILLANNTYIKDPWLHMCLLHNPNSISAQYSNHNLTIDHMKALNIKKHRFAHNESKILTNRHLQITDIDGPLNYIETIYASKYIPYKQIKQSPHIQWNISGISSNPTITFADIIIDQIDFDATQLVYNFTDRYTT
jgi:hypothetical protein